VPEDIELILASRSRPQQRSGASLASLAADYLYVISCGSWHTRRVARKAVDGQRKGKDWFNRVRGIGSSGEFTLPFTM
jgi:hypothetical protein